MTEINPTTRTEGLTGVFKSLRNPTRLFGLSSPRPPSPTGSDDRPISVISYGPDSPPSSSNRLSSILTSPFHSLRSGLAAAASADAVHETNSKISGGDRATTSGHARARSGSTFLASNTQYEVEAAKPIEMPSPRGAISAPVQSPRWPSSPNRGSIRGSIRRRLTFGPTSLPQVAADEVQPLQSPNSPPSPDHVTSPKPVPKPVNPLAPAQPSVPRSISTPSLIKSPTKRRLGGTLGTWALKSLDHIPSFSSSPPQYARPPFRGPIEGGDESNPKSLGEGRRRRGAHRLAAPKPPAPRGLGDNSGRRFTLSGRTGDNCHARTPGESVGDFDEEVDSTSITRSDNSSPEQEGSDGSSIASQGYFSAIISGSSEHMPLSGGPLEFNEEQPGLSNIQANEAPPNPVISSILTSSEIITLLGKRGCKNLSSQLDLQACSQNPLYNGGFGDVYSGMFHDGTKVAIKTMRQYDADGLPDGKYQKRSAKELYTWSKCNHPNVARLLGLAEFRGRLAMISDWADNGNLPQYIKNNPSVNRCSLSTSVCEGLVYLHESNIVHGDLKGSNILISGNGTPMLTDFGNATLDKPTVSFTATAASPSFSLRWTAPEMFQESSLPSRASDVYGLGMTILETITGQVPFSNLKEINISRTVVDKKETPKRPEDQIPTRSICGNLLWALLMSCWAYEPGLRPSAAQVRDHMKLFSPETLMPIEAEPSVRDDSRGPSDNKA